MDIVYSFYTYNPDSHCLEYVFDHACQENCSMLTTIHNKQRNFAEQMDEFTNKLANEQKLTLSLLNRFIRNQNLHCGMLKQNPLMCEQLLQNQKILNEGLQKYLRFQDTDCTPMRFQNYSAMHCYRDLYFLPLNPSVPQIFFFHPMVLPSLFSPQQMVHSKQAIQVAPCRLLPRPSPIEDSTEMLSPPQNLIKMNPHSSSEDSLEMGASAAEMSISFSASTSRIQSVMSLQQPFMPNRQPYYNPRGPINIEQSYLPTKIPRLQMNESRNLGEHYGNMSTATCCNDENCVNQFKNLSRGNREN